ncbi:MAG: hypothetical protein RLZZ65_147 [Bacteroidota bacterium]|jgi:histidinol-phosphate phosphatase family protein
MKYLPPLDPSWSLFLDRDGVINQRDFNGYILKWSDFQFTPGLLENAGAINALFGHVFVVTNQQCVAKELISSEDLAALHTQMIQELALHGLQIQHLVAATEKKGEAPFRRKPNTTMALEIKALFPAVDFQKSIMVGDTDADIAFGKALGMLTILVRSQEKTTQIPDFYIDHLAEIINLIQ